MGFDIGDMFGGVISGGMKLLGGYLDNQANKKNQLEAFQRSFDAQQFENTHSIQQRVADANAAGINPYYAIGAPTMSAPSASVFSSQLGAALGDAGQDISRALKATMDHEDRAQALSLEGLKLNNELKKAALAKARGQIGPPAPSASKSVDPVNPPDVDAALKQQDPQYTAGGSVAGEDSWLVRKGQPYLVGPYGIRIPRGKGMDAQVGEDWGGQLGEFLVGVGNQIESGHASLKKLHDDARRIDLDPYVRAGVHKAIDYLWNEMGVGNWAYSAKKFGKRGPR